jgi:hypothetical protein
VPAAISFPLVGLEALPPVRAEERVPTIVAGVDRYVGDVGLI